MFFWEFFSTFVLVSVVFATAVDDTAAAHFVSVAPLAIGLSLFACAQACGPFTGGCLNPARFLGPAMVFGCGWPYIHAYLFGHYCGGALAGFLFRLRCKLQELYNEAAKQNQHQPLVESSARLDQARAGGRQKRGFLLSVLVFETLAWCRWRRPSSRRRAVCCVRALCCRETAPGLWQRDAALRRTRCGPLVRPLRLLCVQSQC